MASSNKIKFWSPAPPLTLNPPVPSPALDIPGSNVIVFKRSDLNQNNVIKLLAEKLNFSKSLKNFMFLLVEKRRILFVEKIINSFLRLCSQKRGEVKASLISSKALSQIELEQISKDLSNSMGSSVILIIK